MAYKPTLSALGKKTTDLEEHMNKMTSAVIEIQKFQMCFGYLHGHILYGQEQYPLKKFEDKIEIDPDNLRSKNLIIRILPSKLFPKQEDIKIDEPLIHSIDNEML